MKGFALGFGFASSEFLEPGNGLSQVDIDA